MKKPYEFKITDSGCWECTSHRKDKCGYIKITFDGISNRLHRYLYETLFGEIPKGYVVMHKCDNPSCINPEHLTIGTHSDNMKDMVIKNRSLRGIKHPKSKLTDEQVISILNDNRSLHKIANEYDVSFQLIGKIKTGKARSYIKRAS
jgi:hypothetical protein